jgi:biotin synthase
MRLAVPHWIIPAVSAMRSVSEDGYVRAFNAGANLATINLTPRAARANYPIYKHDRFIMDEEGVRSAIEEAGCELSPVGIAEHLALAAERVSGSARAASHPRKAAGVDYALSRPSSPATPEFVEAQNDFA